MIVLTRAPVNRFNEKEINNNGNDDFNIKSRSFNSPSYNSFNEAALKNARRGVVFLPFSRMAERASLARRKIPWRTRARLICCSALPRYVANCEHLLLLIITAIITREGKTKIDTFKIYRVHSRAFLDGQSGRQVEERIDMQCVLG